MRGFPLLEPSETGEEETAAELVPTGPSAAAPTSVLSPAGAAEIRQQAKPALAEATSATTTQQATSSTMINPWTDWRPVSGRGAGVFPMLGKSGQPLSLQSATQPIQSTGAGSPFTLDLTARSKGTGKGTGRDPYFQRNLTPRDLRVTEAS